MSVQCLTSDAEFHAKLTHIHVGLAHRCHARRSLARIILYGCPPVRPRARADERPARVRSAINSLSNSADAAKMPNISFPAGVVVRSLLAWS